MKEVILEKEFRDSNFVRGTKSYRKKFNFALVDISTLNTKIIFIHIYIFYNLGKNLGKNLSQDHDKKSDSALFRKSVPTLQNARTLTTQSDVHLPTQHSIDELECADYIKKIYEGVLHQDKKKTTFAKFIEYKKMSSGEFFCGRVLLATDGILRHKIDKLVAKLTIVSVYY